MWAQPCFDVRRVSPTLRTPTTNSGVSQGELRLSLSLTEAAVGGRGREGEGKGNGVCSRLVSLSEGGQAQGAPASGEAMNVTCGSPGDEPGTMVGTQGQGGTGGEDAERDWSVSGRGQRREPPPAQRTPARGKMSVTFAPPPGMSQELADLGDILADRVSMGQWRREER